MFKSEGTFPVVITRAILGEAKFCKEPNAFDICVEVRGADGATDWWRGEWSGQYGKGNAAQYQQWEMTFWTLQKAGLPVKEAAELFAMLQPDAEGNASIPALVGRETVATVKATEKDGKTYYNVVSIGESGTAAPKALKMSDIAAMFGGQPAAVQQPAPQPQPAPAPAAATPGTIPAFPGATPAAPNGPFANLKR